MKLGLGTVQFGLDYGITNSQGQTSDQEIQAIAKLCLKEGVELIDTASAYGTAEEKVGAFFNDPKLKVVNKVKAGTSLTEIESHFERSSKLCQRETFYGYIFHEAQDLLTPSGEELFQYLVDLKKKQRVQKIGISAYDKETIHTLCERFPIDLIQLPLNLLDQRLLKEGCLDELAAAHIEVHVRSAFLQGLLLDEGFSLPEKLTPLSTHLQSVFKTLKSHHITPLQACLGFLKELPSIQRIIVGVNHVNQLQEIVSEYRKEAFIGYDQFAWQGHADLVDPRKW